MKNHEFSELVNDLRDVPNVQCKRAIISRILTGAGIKPDGHEIALPVLEQQGGWISCSERMPEKDVDVQLYCADKKEQMVGYLETSEQEGYFRYATWRNGQGVYCQPTHWQPLGAPPEAQTSTPPQIDNDGWIEWGGDEKAKPVDVVVDIKCRDGCLDVGWAYIFDWRHNQSIGDIIAYRVIENDGREG